MAARAISTLVLVYIQARAPNDTLSGDILPMGMEATNRRQLKGAPATLCLHGHVAPTVLLIGAQKCGSTSLWSDMQEHVQGTVMARAMHGSEEHYYNKEQHFFDKEERFRKGLAFYVQHYPTCSAARHPLYAMDATPEYLRVPGIAARVHATYIGHTRALRIILIVRNPTDRLRSWFDHIGSTFFHTARMTLDHFVESILKKMKSCASKNYLTTSSEKLWASECRELGPPFSDALAGGMYAPQLQEWLRWFPANQIALVSFAGYVKRADKVLHDIAAFLGQAQASGPPAVHRRALLAVTGAPRAGRRELAIQASHENKKRKHILHEKTRASLDDFYKPHVAAFIELLHRPVARHMRSTPFAPITTLTARALVAGTM